MRLPAALIALCLFACGAGSLPPRGQIVLWVVTDAPLPPVQQATVVTGLPLFDRMRVEVFRPNESAPCPSCTREFGMNAELGRSGASFGLIPPANARGYRARVRLYRSLGREPRAASTLESVVALPPIAAEGVVDVSVTMRVSDLGQPRGTLDAPIDAELGKPADPGVFDPRRSGCGSDPSPGEVCVPGGAFWMGSPNVDYTGPDNDGSLERVVVLSPFFLDAREVSVADMRAFKPVSLDDPHRPAPSWESCTYTQTKANNEDLPVNCVTWVLAKQYCAKQNKRLPTEAELEYVHGATRAAPYPWGSDVARCGDVIADRTGVCAGAGPERAGTGSLDRVGEIVDVAGNVAEWSGDLFQRESEPCWGMGLLTDPLCQTQGAIKDAHAFRGGAFDEGPEFLHAALRRYVRGSLGVSQSIGFRCARSP